MNDTDELYPWEQKDDETEAAYHAFLYGWRDQKLDDPHARRTLTEAARRIYGDPDRVKVPDFIRDWYDKWEWRERAKAWDRYLQRRRDEAAVTGAEDVARKQSVSVAQLTSRQVEVMFDVANKVAEKIQDPAFMKMWLPQHTAQHARAVTEFLNAVAKASALGGGDQAGAGALSDEEAAKADALLEEIFKRDPEVEDD